MTLGMRHSLGHDLLWAGSPRLLKDSGDDRHVLLHCLHARPSLSASHALCSPITVSATGWTHKRTVDRSTLALGGGNRKPLEVFSQRCGCLDVWLECVVDGWREAKLKVKKPV